MSRPPPDPITPLFDPEKVRRGGWYGGREEREGPMPIEEALARHGVAFAEIDDLELEVILFPQRRAAAAG